MRRAVPVAFGLGLAGLVLATSAGAHKGITSKFTYNADVYPVFLNRCGRCHIDGGVGPMSLLKYEDAFPWAEAIRAELTLAHVTDGDPHDFVRSAHRQIPARELDVVLDWTAGGTPEGEQAQTPQPPAFSNDWADATRPTLTVAMPKAFQMGADAIEETAEFRLPLTLDASRTFAQIDLLPGNPPIVRSAVLSLVAPDGTARPLGTWVPRQAPGPIALKPPVRIAPGSHIVARIHYRKTWKFEGQPMRDQSTVGLYAAE